MFYILGRIMETPSEDPYLSGRFGVQYTKGLQNGQDSRYYQGISTLKHWDAYNLEDFNGTDRHHFDAKVTKYDLAATYFPQFKAAIQEGQAKGVMCSYNSLNGVPAVR